MNKELESTCAAYCFYAIKPMLDHTRAMQMKVDEFEQKAENSLMPFEKIGSKFYYIEHDIHLNWWDAGTLCARLGGHLASIQNEDELNAIIQKLSKWRYWLDINDLDKEGEFKSSTSNQIQTFFSWFPGEPRSGGEEDCVHLETRNSDRVYAMNDMDCNFKSCFICEKTL